MQITNIHEAKTHLSKYVDMAFEGEEVIICKAGKPMARLVQYQEKRGPRVLGLWKGKVKIAEDFDETPPSLMQLFYAKEGDQE